MTPPSQLSNSHWLKFSLYFLSLFFLISPIKVLADTSMTYSMGYSELSDRSGSISLENVIISGDLFARTTPDTNDIYQVHFYIDGSNTAFKTESNAPYELNGGGSATRVYDTTALTDGQHIIRSKVVFDNGDEVNFNTTFIVANDEPAQNVVPEITAIDDQFIETSSSRIIDLTETDANGDTLTFSTSTLPIYITFQQTGNNTAQLTLNPLNGDLGYELVVITVSDAELSTQITINIQVVEPDLENPNVNLSTPLDGVTVSELVNIRATATDNVATQQVRFLIDRTTIATDSSSPYSTDWNSIGLTNGNIQISAIASDIFGNESRHDISVTLDNSSAPIQKLQYIAHPRCIDVFDINNDNAFVKTINFDVGYWELRGFIASAQTGMLYLYDRNSMIKIDMQTEQVIWKKDYSDGTDSPAISPDGSLIYMPTDGSSGKWNVIDAKTSNVLRFIQGSANPHNTIVSLDVSKIYMGGSPSNLFVASTETGELIQVVELLINRVRPFTINGTNTFLFTNMTGFLEFQVGDLVTGEVLFTVGADGFPPSNYDHVSHGISLSPDETELYVMDMVNNYVHVYDVSMVPQRAPVQITSIPLIGTQEHGWL